MTSDVQALYQALTPEQRTILDLDDFVRTGAHEAGFGAGIALPIAQYPRVKRRPPASLAMGIGDRADLAGQPLGELLVEDREVPGRILPGSEVIVPALTWSTTIWPPTKSGPPCCNARTIPATHRGPTRSSASQNNRIGADELDAPTLRA